MCTAQCHAMGTDKFDCNLKFLLSSITNKIFKIQRDQERLYTVGWLNTKLGWVEDPEGGRRSPGPANVFCRCLSVYDKFLRSRCGQTEVKYRTCMAEDRCCMDPHPAFKICTLMCYFWPYISNIGCNVNTGQVVWAGTAKYSYIRIRCPIEAPRESG